MSYSYLKKNKVISHFSKYLCRKEIVKSFDRKDYVLFKFINEIIEENKKVMNILDVGCGVGNTLENINKYFPGNNLYGVDMTSDLIEYAKKYRNPKIEFKVGSVLDLPYKDCCFDIVLLENVLHHLVCSNKKDSTKMVIKAITECKRVLKKPGYVLIDECLVRNKFDSYILFYFTYIYSTLNFFNITLPKLEICEDTIVCFLTYQELIDIVEKVGFKTRYKKINLWDCHNIFDYIKQKFLRYPNRNIYYLGIIK